MLNELPILLYTTESGILELAVILDPGSTSSIQDFTPNESIWQAVSRDNKNKVSDAS